MRKRVIKTELDRILAKADDQRLLAKEEILYLLELAEPHELEQLYATARQLRGQHFGKQVFLYGFLYFTTWCRNDCNFCYYRKSNTSVVRYRKTREQVLAAATALAASGVHLIDLTMGEDPFYADKSQGFAELTELVAEIKDTTGAAIMVSPGVVGKEALADLAEAGADWYACYQETYSRKVFRQARIKQDFDKRLRSKANARQAGLLVEEGLLLGLGESLEEVAQSLLAMGKVGAQQVRVMSYVPQAGIPMSQWPSSPRSLELKAIAILRLLYPKALIPASLDVDGLEGLEARLQAGANVITSIIPPSLGLAGVAQNSKDIDEGYRTVAGVAPVVQKLGLAMAELDDYREWVAKARADYWWNAVGPLKQAH